MSRTSPPVSRRRLIHVKKDDDPRRGRMRGQAITLRTNHIKEEDGTGHFGDKEYKPWPKVNKEDGPWSK